MLPCATENVESIINKTTALSSAGTRALTFRHNDRPATVSCDQNASENLGLCVSKCDHR